MYAGVWELCPSGVPGEKPPVKGSGGEAPPPTEAVICFDVRRLNLLEYVHASRTFSEYVAAI